MLCVLEEDILFDLAPVHSTCQIELVLSLKGEAISQHVLHLMSLRTTWKVHVSVAETDQLEPASSSTTKLKFILH